MVGVFVVFVRIGQVEAMVFVAVALRIALRGNIGRILGALGPGRGWGGFLSSAVIACKARVTGVSSCREDLTGCVLSGGLLGSH